MTSPLVNHTIRPNGEAQAEMVQMQTMSMSGMPLAGIVVLSVVLAAMLVVNLTSKTGLLVGFVGLLLCASLAIGRDWRDNPIPTIWLPVQSHRAEGFFVFGLAILGMLVVQGARQRSRGMSPAAWAFAFLSLFTALLRFVHGGPTDGLVSVAFVFATTLPLVLFPRAAIETEHDVVRILRTIAIVNGIWVAMCSAQFLANPKHLTTGNENRFIGLLSNPQHAAALLAIMLVTALWLMLNDRSKKFRLVYAALIAADALLIAWTGSRTGMGMMVLGITGVMYSRAGRAILLLPVVGLFAYAAFKVLAGTVGVESGLSRLSSTENTRSAAWSTLVDTSLSSPLIGVGVEASERSENSWLFAFAVYGVGALLISIIATLLALREFIKIILVRFSMPPHLRPTADYVLAFLTMYFAGAMFEGYMIARVGTPTVLLLIVLGVGAVLRTSLMHEVPVAEEDDGNITGTLPDSGDEQVEQTLVEPSY